MRPFTTRAIPQKPHESPTATVDLSAASIVGFLVIVEFISGLVQGFYPPLVVDIGTTFHIGAGPLNWFNSVVLLSAAVTVPIFSSLGDRYGHRRLLRIAVWCSVVGATLICVAPSYPVILLGRVLEGPIAAWIALDIALIRSRASGTLATRGIGLLASALNGGYLLGTLASGPISSLFGNMLLTLMVPVVLTVMCGLVTAFLIPESTTRTARSIDWVGAIALSVALMSVLLGFIQANSSGWTAPTTWIAMTIGLALLPTWAMWELHTAHPLVDLRLLAGRTLWPAMAVTLLYGILAWGSQVPLVTFLASSKEIVGYGFGLSTSSISLVVTALTMAGVIGSALFATIASKVKVRHVLPIGIGLPAVGYASMALFHTSLWIIVFAMLATGLGTGLLLAGLPTYISGAAPADQVGIASGTYSTVKVLGGSIATAAFGATLSGFTPTGSTVPTVTGYSIVWFTCTAAALAGIVILTLAWRGGRTNPEPAT